MQECGQGACQQVTLTSAPEMKRVIAISMIVMVMVMMVIAKMVVIVMIMV